MITSRLLPRIAIVVPVYNEADSVIKTLSALACYRARGHRIIVVDGGSNDSTPELSAPFADVVICSSKGRALQQNAGAKLADADVLLFLHADTALPDHADSLIIVAMSDGKVVSQAKDTSSKWRSVSAMQDSQETGGCRYGIQWG